MLCRPAVTHSTNPRRRRQRGFSLIIVFLIVLVMVGISAAVMLTTQGDIQVTGHEREAAIALYAAEAGIAWGQQWVYRFAENRTDRPAWLTYVTAQSGAAASSFCTAPRIAGPPIAPTQLPTPSSTLNYAPDGSSPQPISGQLVIYDPVRGGSFQWCVHNNALDPSFTVNKGVGLPYNCQTPNQCDRDNIITIESYGFGPNGATAHLAVDISYYNPPTGRNQDHITAGVDARNSGGGSWLPPATGTGAPTWQTTSF